jgi:hypothetical protein
MICQCFRPLNCGENQPNFESWLRAFLEGESVRSELPELRIPPNIDPFPIVVTYGAYEFEGAMTRLLLSDGAYYRSELSEDQARTMAREFVDAIVSSSRKHATIYRLDGPWCGWFYDIAWDASFVVRNAKTQRVWLICVTDTD